MKQVQKTKQKVKANGLQAMIRDAIAVLKGYVDPLTIEELKADTGYTNGRALSAALRVARRDGRVLFDGKRYSLPASVPLTSERMDPVPGLVSDVRFAPATTPAPPPFSADGPLTRVDDDAPVTPTLPSPRPQTIVPPAPLPAWVKDGQRVRGIGDMAGRAGVLAWAMGRKQWAVMNGNLCIWVGDAALVPTRWKPALPAWLRDGQRVRGIGAMSGCKGVLHPKQVGGWFIQDGKAVLDIYDAAGIEKEWAPVYDAQPAPGFARDLAERQAFRPSTARERIASVLRGAGLTEATEAQPGVIVRVGRDGRIGLRWGVKRADGATSSAAVTEHAERLMERAANALHDAGYKAVEWQCASEELAPRPSEAAERIAALEAELATAKQRLAAVTTALTSTTLALSLAVGGAP